MIAHVYVDVIHHEKKVLRKLCADDSSRGRACLSKAILQADEVILVDVREKEEANTRHRELRSWSVSMDARIPPCGRLLFLWMDCVALFSENIFLLHFKTGLRDRKRELNCGIITSSTAYHSHPPV